MDKSKKVISEEHKKKISLANKGKSPFLGRKHSEEAKKRIAEKRKGIKFSESHLENLRKSHMGHKHTIETRLKMSKSRSGEKSHFWKGGKTKESKIIRSSMEYQIWREAVFKRDGYECVWCGDKCSKGNPVELNADHIKPFALFPELRFAIDNGRTLCRPCHMTTVSWGNRYTKKYE